MDDILCFYVRNDKWDYAKFIQDLCKSEVYVKPLTLEDGKEDDVRVVVRAIRGIIEGKKATKRTGNVLGTCQLGTVNLL